MQLIRFLNIIQRIIILFVIIGFIPLTWFVFLPHEINLTNDHITAYQNIYKQISSGFIVGQNNNNCNISNNSSYFFQHTNDYCLKYCKIGQNCQIIDPTYDCPNNMSNKYIVYGHKYCYNGQTKQYKNQISSRDISSNNITLNFNISNPPLFNITISPQNKNNEISLSYYLYNGNISCLSQIKQIGFSIKLKSILISQKYLMSMKFMYFTFLPIFSITLLSIFLQICTRLSFKKTMQISLFNSSIITISIIIIGVMFDIDSSQFQNNIKFIAMNCIISNYQGQIMKNKLLVDLTNGLNTGLTVVMGIVGILELLFMVALAIVWGIEIRMVKLRKQDHQESNYQLQTL